MFKTRQLTLDSTTLTTDFESKNLLSLKKDKIFYFDGSVLNFDAVFHQTSDYYHPSRIGFNVTPRFAPDYQSVFQLGSSGLSMEHELRTSNYALNEFESIRNLYEAR